jgi:hypothetical protein
MVLKGNSFSLEVLWSTEIIGAPPSTFEFGTGLTLRAQSVFPDGRIVWLGNYFAPGAWSQTLLVDAEHAQADRGVILELDGVVASIRRRSLFERILGANTTPDQQPFVSTLTVGPGGEIWVAGLSNQYMSIDSFRHSDAYLARVDEAGRPLWENTYSNGGRRKIRSVARMESGNLAIAGSDSRDGWLALVSPDGRQLWERRLGNDLDIAVAALSDDRLALVGFESTGSGAAKDHQQHVTTWIISSGSTLAKTRVRNPIDKSPYYHVGRVCIAVTGNVVYVASNWQDPSDARPVEVAKLQPDGTLLWRAVLSDSVKAPDTDHPSWKTCSPTLAITPRGDAVIACALDQIHVYHLDRSSGTYRQSCLAVPACQAGRPADLFLDVRHDGTMILSGSRPASNSGAGCTWIARLSELP